MKFLDHLFGDKPVTLAVPEEAISCECGNTQKIEGVCLIKQLTNNEKHIWEKYVSPNDGI